MNAADLCRILEDAYRKGWEHGVRDFAIWRDGQQLVGCMEKPLHTVLAKGITTPSLHGWTEVAEHYAAKAREAGK